MLKSLFYGVFKGIVHIFVLLIAVVLIFKEQIMDLVENIMKKITNQAMRV
ncbi:MAG: hypothetical protein IKK59_06325 [Lachnospiraceae bacterium]|nr:hypothetical protein [Lachnospiraceae bacterium]